MGNLDAATARLRALCEDMARTSQTREDIEAVLDDVKRLRMRPIIDPIRSLDGQREMYRLATDSRLRANNAEAERDKLKALLLDHQWASFDQVGMVHFCRVCDEPQRRGHRDNCGLAEALK